VYSFADDTAIVCSASDVVELRQVVLENLNKIHTWFKQNKLKLNYQKTKILHYKIKNSDQNLENMKIDLGCGESYNLEIENTTKYLGVILDSKLTWENHILYTEKKLRKINYTLWHLTKFFDSNNLIKIYKVLFDPILRYNLINWGGAAFSHRKRIMGFQQQAVRTCLGIGSRESVSNLFKKNKIFDLNKLYKFSLGSFIFRYQELLGVEVRLRPSASLGIIQAKVPNWTRERSRRQAPYTVPAQLGGLGEHLQSLILERKKYYFKNLKMKLMND